MNFLDILFMKKVGKIKPDAGMIEKLWWKKMYEKVWKLVTIVGNPLDFIAKKAQTAQSTKVTLSPVQAGSGDPSPTNIRHISGRSSVEIKGCGKNQFNKDDSSSIIKAVIPSGSTGTISSSNNSRLVFIRCKPNTTYTVSKTVGVRFRVATTVDIPAVGVACSQTISDNTAGSITITTNATAKYLCSYVYNSNVDSGTAEAMIASVQIEEGSATAYEPYAESNDVTISFGETVYGGTLDVETGVLTVDKKLITIDDYSWVYSSAASVFMIDFSDCEDFDTSIISSALVTTNAAEFQNMPPWSVKCGRSQDTKRIFIKVPSDVTTRQQLFDAIGNETICYKLAEPITIQLNPSQIQILKGGNTIWIEDEGSVMELTYKA